MTFQRYEGVAPPFTGLAVKVTGEPGQKGFADADMVMLTGKPGLTDTGCWMLDAGLFVVHNSDDVTVQETRSPLFGIYAYTGLLFPGTGLLFTNHW